MSRPLVPREHGIYVQLFAPLLTALVLREPSASAALLAIGITAAFFGTEAILVVRGGRGARRRELDGARASKRIRVLGSVAVGCGATGLVIAPLAAAQLASLVAIPAILALVLGTQRRLHTRTGEVLVAIALAGAAAPVAAASGIARGDAVLLWAMWSAGFAATVFAVHGVIARGRDPQIDVWQDLYLAAVGIVGSFVWANATAGVALPLVIAAIAITLVKPSAKRLRFVGLALTLASAVSMMIAIAVVD